MAQQEVDSQAQYPWSTVVYLEVTWPDGEGGRGSGVMVGPNDVLTAAHMVYSSEHGGEATEVRVTPAYDPDPHEAPFGTVEAYDWHYYSDFASDFDPDGDGGIDGGDEGAGLGGTELDIALLDLDVPLGNETGWMHLDPNFESGFVNVTGYPGYYDNNMMNDSGYVQDDMVDWYINISNLEIHPGNSGGPIWYNGDDDQPYVVGVVSTGVGDQGYAGHDIRAEYAAIVDLIASNDSAIA